MSQIAYDPVKDKLAAIIRNSRPLRRLFYVLLDTFFLRSWHVRKKLRAVHQKLKTPSQILDAGSGFGQYDHFILKHMKPEHLLAVDVKQQYLDDCAFFFEKEIAKGRITLQKQDLLEFSKPGHDIVLCVDVLEHIEEDVKVMRNMRESLRPGGYFLMHSPSAFAEEDAGEDDFFVDEHARAGYSQQELRSKFKQAGLKPVDIRYTYGPYGHAAWVMMIKWPMLLLNKVGFGAAILLPFWYAIILLPSLLLHRIDLGRTNVKGTGIIGLAQRPEA